MAASLSYQASDVDTGSIGDNGTYTFPLTVASAAGQERLVVLAGIGGPATSVDFDACTIDGQTATRVGTISRGANDGGDACAFLTFYRAPGTSGTSIDVVATANCPGNSVVAGFCSCWSLNDADTLLDTTNASGNDPVLSTDTAAGGTAAAAIMAYANTTLETAWTGLTERVDGLTVFNDDLFSSASDDFASASTPLTISADIAAGFVASIAGICVSFNPVGAANATASPTGSAATASIGSVSVETRPPPPYTLTTVTG